MMGWAQGRAEIPAATKRLAAIAPLSAAATSALNAAVQQRRHVKARRELLHEGAPVTDTLIMLRGWAARVRQLEDGRRQIMSFLVPGDMIGNCWQPEPLAASTVVALTELEFCVAPAAKEHPSLACAYAISHAYEEAYLLAHVTRLGRMNAEERLSDLLLELHERLSLAGLGFEDGFYLPLTQEVLADAVGLSGVHMNRTIQQLRRQGDITLKSSRLTFEDRQDLAQRLGRSPVRVSAWINREQAR